MDFFTHNSTSGAEHPTSHHFSAHMLPYSPTERGHQPRLLGSGLSLPPRFPGSFHDDGTVPSSLQIGHSTPLLLPRTVSDVLPVSGTYFVVPAPTLMNPWTARILCAPTSKAGPVQPASLTWMAAGVPHGKHHGLRVAAKSLMLEIEAGSSHGNTEASARVADVSFLEADSEWAGHGEGSRKRMRGGHSVQQQQISPRCGLERAAQSLLAQMQEELSSSEGKTGMSDAAMHRLPGADASTSSRRQCLKTAATMLLQELERSSMEEDLGMPPPAAGASNLTPMTELGGEQGEHKREGASCCRQVNSAVRQAVEYPSICDIMRKEGDRSFDSCHMPAVHALEDTRLFCETPELVLGASRKRKACAHAPHSMGRRYPCGKGHEAAELRMPWGSNSGGSPEDGSDVVNHAIRDNVCSTSDKEKPSWPLLFGVELVPAVE